MSPTRGAESASVTFPTARKRALDVALPGRRRGDAEGATLPRRRPSTRRTGRSGSQTSPHARVAESQLERSSVNGLVDHLLDAHEVGLVEVHAGPPALGGRGAGLRGSRRGSLRGPCRRTDPHAPAAARAQHVAKPRRIDRELVIDPLPDARRLDPCAGCGPTHAA